MLYHDKLLKQDLKYTLYLNQISWNWQWQLNYVKYKIKDNNLLIFDLFILPAMDYISKIVLSGYNPNF